MGEMAQGEITALLEDLFSVASTHMVAYNQK